MSTGLMPRQRETLEFIVAYQAERGLSPSFSEIAKAVGVGKSRIHYLILGLWRRGYVDFKPGRWRSIIVLEQPTFTLPPDTLAKLYAFCQATKENPADVVADAVTLHLDELALKAAA